MSFFTEWYVAHWKYCEPSNLIALEVSFWHVIVGSPRYESLTLQTINYQEIKDLMSSICLCRRLERTRTYGISQTLHCQKINSSSTKYDFKNWTFWAVAFAPKHSNDYSHFVLWVIVDINVIDSYKADPNTLIDGLTWSSVFFRAKDLFVYAKLGVISSAVRTLNTLVQLTHCSILLLFVTTRIILACDWCDLFSSF